jgi:undecaprenyl-diphosphatase
MFLYPLFPAQVFLLIDLPALLYQLDVAVFRLCNRTIANPVFDIFFPFITDLNQHWYGWVLFVGLWLLLMTKGGKKGRTVGLLVIVVVAMSDQISSKVIKYMVMRPRPCWLVDGKPIVENVRLLVSCGGGYSFPSSHAVNNFAIASYVSHYYRKWSGWFFLFAFLMAFSRLYIGVHYPSDALGGAAIGGACAGIVIVAWELLSKRFPLLEIK